MCISLSPYLFNGLNVTPSVQPPSKGKPIAPVSQALLMSDSPQAVNSLDALLFNIPTFVNDGETATTRYKRSAQQMDHATSLPKRAKEGSITEDEQACEGSRVHSASRQFAPELQTLLEKIQNAKREEIFKTVAEVISGLSTREVGQIFAQLKGFHFWRRACIVCCLTRKQRGEWNASLFRQQASAATHPLKQVPINDNNVQEIRQTLQQWDEQMQSQTVPQINSLWGSSYLANHLLIHKDFISAMLQCQNQNWKPVLDLLNPAQIVDLLTYVSDQALPALVLKIELHCPHYCGSIFAECPAEMRVKIGRLIRMQGVAYVQQVMQNRLSWVEKEQFVYAVAQFRPAAKESEMLLQLEALLKKGLLWLGHLEAVHLVTLYDPECVLLAKILLKDFSPELTQSLISNISADLIVKIAAASSTLIIPLLQQVISYHPLYSEPEQKKQILKEIAIKKIEAVRKRFTQDATPSRNNEYGWALKFVFQVLDKNIFSQEEVRQILEGEGVPPSSYSIPMTWEAVS